MGNVVRAIKSLRPAKQDRSGRGRRLDTAGRHFLLLVCSPTTDKLLLFVSSISKLKTNF